MEKYPPQRGDNTYTSKKLQDTNGHKAISLGELSPSYIRKSFEAQFLFHSLFLSSYQ